VTLVIPEGTPTLGNTKLKAVLTMASLTAPSLATAINAATSEDISCYVYPEGWAPSMQTNKGTKRPRLCTAQQFEQFNRTTYSWGALQYVHNPQTADASPGNEMREMFVEGLKLYIVERQGLDANVAFAATQRVLVHYVELGPQWDSGDVTDENGEFFITQDLIYVNTGPVRGVIAA
jgi:hypothetical protein